MDLVVYDDDDQRYVPWVVALGAVLLAVLLGVLASGAVYLATRGEEPAPQAEPIGGLSSPQAASPAAAEPECAAALTRAQSALDAAGRLDQALEEHTRVVEDLLAERITTQQALDRALPVLTTGATDRSRFAEELAAYEAARGACGQ